MSTKTTSLPPIATVGALREYLGASAFPDGVSASMLSRRLFKNTDCGASVSFLPAGGDWHHNGSHTRFTDDTVLKKVLLNTIVEGSDAEFSIELLPSATADDYDRAIIDLEGCAEEAWQEANYEEDEDAEDESEESDNNP